MVDEDTMSRLENGKIPLENYEKLVDWIRAREVRLTSFSTRGPSSKDPSAMVYGVADAPARYEIHTPDASSGSPEAGSSQRSASPWTPPA